MPESLTFTTTAGLPVVICHACGAETCGNHADSANSGSLGAPANKRRLSKFSTATTWMMGRTIGVQADMLGILQPQGVAAVRRYGSANQCAVGVGNTEEKFLRARTVQRGALQIPTVRR